MKFLVAVALLPFVVSCQGEKPPVIAAKAPVKDAQPASPKLAPVIVNVPGHYDAKEQMWVSDDPQYETDKFEKGNEYAVVDKVDGERTILGMGLINKQGLVVVPTVYDGIGVGFTDGLCHVSKKNKWGLVNKQGAEVIAPQYEDIAEKAEDGLLSVRKNDLTGFINLKGEMVIPVKYKSAEISSEGMIAVMNVPQKWGYIDHQDKMIIEPQFSAPGRFENGKVVLQKEDGEEYTVYKDGKIEKKESK